MPVIRPRTRLVYFRVSEDEFKKFGEVCKSTGARSISDLARSAMERVMLENKVHHEDEMARRLRILDEIIAELTEKIQQLNIILGGSTQTASGDSRTSPEETPVGM